MHSVHVREFVELAFACADRRILWRGEGRDELGIDAQTGAALVAIDPRYFRPAETDSLCGDPARARHRLGWRHRTRFPDLVREMVAADMAAVPEELRRRTAAGARP